MLSSGLPEYGVPPCEPLVIPLLTVKQSAGPIHITSSYHDVIVKGLASMRVKEVRYFVNMCNRKVLESETNFIIFALGILRFQIR